MTAQTVAAPVRRQRGFNLEKWGWLFTVSYTHLTLPTIYSV